MDASKAALASSTYLRKSARSLSARALFAALSPSRPLVIGMKFCSQNAACCAVGDKGGALSWRAP
eukprot:1888678-Pyramimonas_sp.AAC.1